MKPRRVRGLGLPHRFGFELRLPVAERLERDPLSLAILSLIQLAPASSYAIMRRARPYRGENNGPGKDIHGELDPTPGIREQPGSNSVIAAMSAA